MSFMINYTKAQYEAKVSELEGYYSQLSDHLSKMEDLKNRMYQFWDDENARTTGKMLEIEIRQVRNSMERTKDILNFYKSSIAKLDSSNSAINNTLQEAISILTGLGI